MAELGRLSIKLLRPVCNPLPSEPCCETTLDAAGDDPSSLRKVSSLPLGVSGAAGLGPACVLGDTLPNDSSRSSS